MAWGTLIFRLHDAFHCADRHAPTIGAAGIYRLASGRKGFSRSGYSRIGPPSRCPGLLSDRKASADAPAQSHGGTSTNIVQQRRALQSNAPINLDHVVISHDPA